MFHLKDSRPARIFIFILFIAASHAVAQAVSPSPDDSVFVRGVELFSQGSYEQSLKNFQWLTRDGATYRREESKLFLAKIHMQSKMFSVAEIELKELLKTIPPSSHKDEIRFTLSDALWRQKKQYEALTVLMNGTMSLQSDSVRQINTAYITSLIDKLTAKELQDATDAYKGKQEEVVLVYCRALGELQKGDREKAKKLLYPVIANIAANPYRDYCVKLYQTLESEDFKSSNNYVIGVMLPLTIKDKSNSPATEVLDGIKFAINSYNTKGIKTVGLSICDTRRDTTVIDSIAKEFGKIPSLKAVVGPLYSDECKRAARDLYDAKTPLFSPTATDETLTAQSPYFWQANPTFSVRGRTMAHYLFEQEKKRKIAVIFSDEGNSSLYAKAFAREFVALRGSVVLEDKYKLDNPDLTKITNKLKAQQKNIDGVFLPVSNQKIINDLLSSFEQAELVMPIYGNQDWYNAPELSTSTTLSNMLVFCSDYFLDYANSDFTSLNDGFYAVTGYDINRNVLYGYDTANLILQSLEVQSTIPPDGGIMRSLNFKGMHNDYSFKGGKINSSVNVIRCQDGIFQRIITYNPDSGIY